MKIIQFLFLLGLNFVCYSQADLAIQRAHSDDIIQLEFSNTGRYLASCGRNNEFVIWDVNHQKSISSFSLSSIESIRGMKFSDDEKQLLVKTDRTTFFYELTAESITQKVGNDALYRSKTILQLTDPIAKIYIRKGLIYKRISDKRLPRYRLSVPNVKAKFVAFDVNTTKNLLLAVAEDEKLYVYNYNFGVKWRELIGHSSQIFDVRFAPDGNTFVTAGRDRSIVIWDTKTLKIKSRLTSNVFRKKTVAFSHDGLQLYVGDELGYVYGINFNTAFPQISVMRNSFHAVNKILPNPKTGTDYFIATENNFIYRTNDPLSVNYIEKYQYRDHAFLEMKSLLIQNKIHTYQEPFGKIKKMVQSPNGEYLAYIGESNYSGVTYAEVQSGKVAHFYEYYNDENWVDVDFLNDSTFVAIHDSSKVLHFWMLDNSKAYLKTDTLSYVLQDIEVIDSATIWLNTKHYGQFLYNPYTRLPEKIISNSAREIFRRGDFLVLETFSGALDFYNLKERKMYNRFIGHKDKVTDVQFHPDGNKFVTSSNDGTIRFWDLMTKKSLATFIPFTNGEFVLITGENYYLMSKGAMAEIGFKVNGKYYYPEQFDLKYNRPDLVLSSLNFSDKDLIKAYRQAYLKRLKKMNFREDQLSANFNLPTIELINRVNIPSSTSDDSIVLALHLMDEFVPLDRINIWVNNVAVHGIKGVDVRAEKIVDSEKNITVFLADGKNKIEISVLNQNAIESYKEIIEVEKKGNKNIPRLFIASVGTSKYEDARYNLNYADKDAKDLAFTLNQATCFSDIKSLVLTNEEVTIENLVQIKSFFAQANINDVVVLFIAGHGVLDVNFNYYFATHDIDFSHPAERGVPYESIEQLLDGIKALKKLLFIDTCHSGELDKDEIKVDQSDHKDNENGEIIFRRAGVSVALKDDPLNLQSTNDLMKFLFTDLRKGTGATVVSSSGGVELSIETNLLKNGLFTYVLINGLKSGEADLNQDGKIYVSEIQAYTQQKVHDLSNGLQTPTSRIQNMELDYELW